MAKLSCDYSAELTKKHRQHNGCSSSAEGAHRGSEDVVEGSNRQECTIYTPQLLLCHIGTSSLHHTHRIGQAQSLANF